VNIFINTRSLVCHTLTAFTRFFKWHKTATL